MGALKNELTPHLVVPVDGSGAGRHDHLVYAPCEFIRVTPYASSSIHRFLYTLLVLCTGGILGIVSVWFPQVKTRLARKRLSNSSLGDADYMLVLVHEDGWRSTYIEVPVHRVVHTDKTPVTKRLPWVWFEFKQHRYVFNHSKGAWERYLATVTEDLATMRARLATGLPVKQATQKEAWFGANVVDIEPPHVGTLLFTKSVHPYYLFQVFSATVWFCQDYTLFATVIATLSVCSLTWEIYSEMSNSNRLRALVRSDRHVHVLRDGVVATRHESALVPGDIVELRHGQVVADMLLLRGGCVVDEAALTGEAVPINKEAARGHATVITDASARLQFKSSFLHAGSTITRVREASGPCKGVVLSTGFSTGKGELFRSILFPREITFEFERDAYRFLAVLATVAVVAFTKRMVDFDADAHTVGYMLSNSLALVTIAVPPALPIVLSSGIGIALARLNEMGIFCIDARRINSCGQLDTFCFDKTGALTEASLQLVGVDVIAHHEALEHVTIDTMPRMMRLAMATCHSLSEADGLLQGYSLELSMFDKAHAALEFVHDHSPAQPYLAIASLSHGDKFGVVKRFPFDPTYQRSSVIVENLETKQRFVFVKGSLEAIRAIAVDMPAAFEQKSRRYGADGHYCIGFGMRALAAGENINTDTREAVEASVDVMGIALFHNELKSESKAMLQELYAAAIDVRMITGDNALTAVHVARLLDMELKSSIAVVDVNESHEVVYHGIEELRSAEQIQWEPLTSANIDRVLAEYDVALTGAALEQLSRSLTDESLKLLLLETRIFARIRPMQKSWIVEKLMDYGRMVGMCGDGTNDCGALKAAHVGLALSSAEASIVAPFTSKAKAVTDVPVLIREGRCALTTSFLGFKFMVLYPVIQLGMASTLGHWGCKLSNNQYIWDDMGIVLGMALTMVYTRSSTTLSKERPPKSLFSLSIVASILGQCVLFIAFFAVVLVMMYDQSWFCQRADGMAYMDLYRNDPASVFSADFSQQVLTNCEFFEKYTPSGEESSETIPVGHEIAVTWLFAHMQYFSVAAAFNLKDKFRRPFYTNFWFTSYFVVSLGANLWFLLDDSGTIDELFQSLPLTKDFRWTMLWVFGLHFVSALAWEMLATWYLPPWRRQRAEAKKDKMAYPEYVTNQLPVNSNKAKEEALLTGIQVSRR